MGPEILWLLERNRSEAMRDVLRSHVAGSRVPHEWHSTGLHTTSTNLGSSCSLLLPHFLISRPHTKIQGKGLTVGMVTSMTHPGICVCI